MKKAIASFVICVFLTACSLVEFETIQPDVTQVEDHSDVTETPDGMDIPLGSEKHVTSTPDEYVTSDLYVCPRSGYLYFRVGAGTGSPSNGYLAAGSPVKVVTSEGKVVTSDGAVWVKIVQGWVNERFLCNGSESRDEKK
jgi:hypothetical protein